MSPSRLIATLLGALVLALALAACGDDDGGGDVGGIEALSESFCAEAEYGGEGEPSALIVSDLPMQGDSAELSKQMVEAIRQALADAGWKAGATDVAFQACDEPIETGESDAQRCRDNATAYAGNPDVIGVIGSSSSRCAAEMIPILNEAPDGGLAMVSPANTAVCLTQSASICERDEPDVYYPNGKRNYVRVVSNDAAQGAGLASFAQRHAFENPYVLYADDPTSLGQAETFQNAAEALDLTIAGFEAYDPKARNYRGLMEEVSASGADSVVLAGRVEQNGVQLIKDKVAVLGPNLEDPETGEGGIALLAPDGFALQGTIDDAGEAASGMFVSVPGKTPDSLSGAGRDFVEQLEETLVDVPVDFFAPYAGQATQVLLQAAEGGIERAEIVNALIGLEIADGIVGDFTIEESGDPSVSEITVSVARDTFELNDQITPSLELIAAARGEDVEVPDASDTLDGTSTTP